MKSPRIVMLAMLLSATLVAAAPADLINYWTFDANGVDAVTGYTGTFLGDAAVTTVPGEARIGLGSLKVAHNNAHDYFAAEHPVIPGHGVYTVTGWYKWDTSFSANAVDSRAHVYETTPSWSSGIGIYTGDTNRFRTAFWADGTTTDVTRHQFSPARIDDGQWHFFAVAYDSVANVTSYYHDGQFQSNSAAPPIVYSHGINIGAYRDGGARNWQGYIDDFAVYEGIVPAAEIQKLYQGTATPQTVAVDRTNAPAPVPTGTLVGYWQFDSDFDSAVNTDHFVSTPQGNTSTATYTSIDTTAGAAARGAGSLKLDSGPNSGNGTYVKVDGAVLNGARDQQMAISAWFKYEDISGDGSDERNAIYETSPAYSLSLGIIKTREYQWFTDTNAPPPDPSTSWPNWNGLGDAPVEEGQWYHVVTNYDLAEGRMQLFCNGVLISDELLADEYDPPIDGSYFFDYTNGFNIGNHRAGDGARDFDGYIDDVAVFRGVLSPDGVAGLYNGTYSPLTVPVFRDFAAVPEPGTFALLTTLFLLAVGWHRPRKNR